MIGALRSVFALVGLMTILLATPSRADDVRLPLGPSIQSQARDWAKPMEVGVAVDPSGLALREVMVAPYAVTYTLAGPTSPPAAKVSVVFDSKKQSVTVSTHLTDPSARELVQRLERTLQVAVAPTRLRVAWIDPEPSSPRAPPPESPWWIGVEQWLVLFLLILLAIGLVLSAPALRAGVGTLSRPEAGALTCLLAGSAVFLWAGADTVLYHSGHGWNLAEMIHRGDTTDPHAGALAPLWSHLLGWPAAAGNEAFLASRIGALLSVLFLWLWLKLVEGERGSPLTGRRVLPLLAALLLAIQPALHVAGRSEYVATPGLALLLLALCLATVAGRERRWNLLVTATAAIGLVACFRALGMVAWPLGALMFFVPTPREGAPRGHWLLIPCAIAGLMATPALMRVLGVGDAYMPSEGLALIPDFGRDQLLADSHWTAATMGWLALGGAVFWFIRRNPEDGFQTHLLALGLVGLFWGIVMVTQHVAGTYLNTPRYHTWLLVPGCVGAAVILAVLFGGGRWRRVAGGVLSLFLVWGLVHPWSLSVERHPESRQLDAWRSTAQALPQSATLYVPRHRGEHKVSLPFAILRGERPDIKVVRGPIPDAPGTFAFKPLDCLRPSLAPADGVRDDCQRFNDGWRPVPEAHVETTWTVPSPDGDAMMEGAIHGEYWVYPPLRDPPGVIGLFVRR